MDIWERLYEAAKKEYHPEEVSPFIDGWDGSTNLKAGQSFNLGKTEVHLDNTNENSFKFYAFVLFHLHVPCKNQLYILE